MPVLPPIGHPCAEASASIAAPAYKPLGAKRDIGWNPRWTDGADTPTSNEHLTEEEYARINSWLENVEIARECYRPEDFESIRDCKVNPSTVVSFSRPFKCTINSGEHYFSAT
ncbi:hypothetical protein RUND412_006159 [Rhizina undulata]